VFVIREEILKGKDRKYVFKKRGNNKKNYGVLYPQKFVLADLYMRFGEEKYNGIVDEWNNIHP
jgi:hypothetical protein